MSWYRSEILFTTGKNEKWVIFVRNLFLCLLYETEVKGMMKGKKCQIFEKERTGLWYLLVCAGFATWMAWAQICCTERFLGFVCECVCLGEKGKLLQSFSTEGKTQFLCFLNPLMHKFDTLDTFNVSTHFLHSGQRCHVEIKIKS